MKFKIGDKVRIIGCYRNISSLSSYYLFVQDMEKYIGEETTIVKIIENHKAYNLKIDNSRFGWDEKWIEPIDDFLKEEDFKIDIDIVHIDLL